MAEGKIHRPKNRVGSLQYRLRGRDCRQESNHREFGKKFFPEYDSKRYHYYEENEWREDFEETPEEEEYDERCESAYRDAAAYINEYYSEFKIAERHTEIKKKISAEISNLAKQAKNVDASFWHGEPWEREFRSWNI